LATLEKIGKYEILEKIGEGGFGVVYKGKDPFIKRLVAVKTCSSENESIQKRFFREAEIAGNLHHANVVTIHDFGVEGETPYLVQEFLTGEDLDVLINDPSRHLSLPTKVRYLRGIAEGLRYAHAQGVIHRDIKPSNIRVLENHRVKVMDFGIAKLKDQESQLTQTGMALGTVAYMSPEQLKGEKVDHRVDIFSFGVLAYELLVGKRPFHADSVSTLFYQLLHENPPPIEDPEVPAELKTAVEKCLAKTLDVRYRSFDDVLVDLETVQSLVGDDEEAITDDPFSGDATSSAARLVAKTARSIAAGDLTAAEQTLDIARRECDRATFDREFGALVAQLETRRNAAAARQAATDSGMADSGAVDLRSEIAAIDSQLRAGRTDTAAVAFTALELQHPQHPEVAALRQRFAEAFSRPSTVSAPQPPPPTGVVPPRFGSAPPRKPASDPAETEQQLAPVALAGAGAVRQRARTGPLVATAAAIVLLGTVGAVFLARTLLGDKSGDAQDRVEKSAEGDTLTDSAGSAIVQIPVGPVGPGGSGGSGGRAGDRHRRARRGRGRAGARRRGAGHSAGRPGRQRRLRRIRATHWRRGRRDAGVRPHRHPDTPVERQPHDADRGVGQPGHVLADAAFVGRPHAADVHLADRRLDEPAVDSRGLGLAAVGSDRTQPPRHPARDQAGRHLPLRPERRAAHARRPWHDDHADVQHAEHGPGRLVQHGQGQDRGRDPQQRAGGVGGGVGEPRPRRGQPHLPGRQPDPPRRPLLPRDQRRDRALRDRPRRRPRHRELPDHPAQDALAGHAGDRPLQHRRAGQAGRSVGDHADPLAGPW
jgi:predicted Ser/Thr protein kinase